MPAAPQRLLVLGALVALVAVGGVTLVHLARDGATPAAAGCPAGGLRVIADPGIAPVLSGLAQRYTQETELARADVRETEQARRNSPDRGQAIRAEPDCVVHVTARTSADAAALLAGRWDNARQGTPPQVWIPDSSAWSRILGARTSGADRVARSGPPVAFSPTVIALPTPMAQALGWAARPVHWQYLLDVLADPRGWTAYGHPEWGRIRLAVPDPTRSTEGLAAVLATAGTLRGLNQEDYLPVSSPGDTGLVARLAAVRRATARTAPDTEALLADLRRAAAADPTAALRTAPIFPAAEQDVWRYNSQNPAVRLTAVYPVDGTPTAEYPYLLVGRDQMTAADRKVSAGFLRYLRSPDAQDRLVAQAFRRGPAAEGAPFTPAAGLAPIPPRDLLPATGGGTLASLAETWNRLGPGGS
jgi:Ca-activated chloride channel family protein